MIAIVSASSCRPGLPTTSTVSASASRMATGRRSGDVAAWRMRSWRRGTGVSTGTEGGHRASRTTQDLPLSTYGVPLSPPPTPLDGLRVRRNVSGRHLSAAGRSSTPRGAHAFGGRSLRTAGVVQTITASLLFQWWVQRVEGASTSSPSFRRPCVCASMPAPLPPAPLPPWNPWRATSCPVGGTSRNSVVGPSSH